MAKFRFFLNCIAVLAMVYLVVVATGAYNVVLSKLSTFMNIPEYLVLSSQHHLSLFLALSLLYTFFTTPARKGSKVGVIDVILGVIAFTASIYRFVEYNELSTRIGLTTTEDIVFGTLTIVLLIEAIRRKVGIELATIVTAFVVYGLWDVNFDIKTFVERIYLFNIGIYSTPLEVAVLMISIFLLLGSLLEVAGISEYFTKLAMALAGRSRGGPAKVTVLSTALLGTSTGSATGATAIIGTITIPAMVKIGMTPEYAAAITAASGTGSQIMPPVLGSAAFIMPLYLGTTYWHVVVASIIPALLYYIYLFLYVDLISIKLNLKGLSGSELPSKREVLLEIYLFFPIILLIFLLATGYEAETSALGSLLAVLLIATLRYSKIFGSIVSVSLVALLAIFTYLFGSIALSILLASAVLVIFSIVVGIRQETRHYSTSVTNGISKAFRESVSIILTCAGAGIIAGVLSLTGLSYTLGQSIWNISGGNLYIVLLFVMLISILLGFGLPTPVVYVTTVSILGPLAIFLQLPKTALHYFIFFFGVFAPLTPPVALASYAAASIAKSNFWKTGILAFYATIASWVTAWAFILRPNLLLVTLNNINIENVLTVLLDALIVIISMIFLLASLVGTTWKYSSLNSLARLTFLVIGGFGLICLLIRWLIPIYLALFVVTYWILPFVKTRLRGEAHAR